MVATVSDPTITKLSDAMNDALRGLGARDATVDALVATARLALERATRLYDAFKADPALAVDYPAPADSYARGAVRASVTNMAACFKDPKAYERIACEVLGDRANAAPACPHCGAPCDSDGAGITIRCASCGAVFERLAGDSWVHAKLAQFGMVLASLHDKIDRYDAALAAFACVGAFDVAGPARAATFVRRAIPWLPADELHRAIELYRRSGEAQRGFDEMVRLLEPWVANPAQRPAVRDVSLRRGQ
jgi:hypothetical protein